LAYSNTVYQVMTRGDEIKGMLGTDDSMASQVA
jgi:hypothetical protein